MFMVLSRQVEDTFVPALGSSAVDYSNSFVGVGKETVAMSNQPSSAGGGGQPPVQDAAAEISNEASGTADFSSSA